MTSLMTETSDLIDVIRKTLARSSEPLPPGKVASQLTGPFKTPRQTVADILADLAEQGRVHEFAPYRTQEKRYWTRDVNAYVRETLLKLLSAKSLTRSELKEKRKTLLKSIREDVIASEFSDLLANEEIRKLPPHIGARTDRFGSQPVDVSEYTDYAIKKLSEKLEKCGVTREQIIAAIVARQPAQTSVDTERTDPPQRENETSTTDSTAIGNQILERLREDLELHNRPIALVADVRRSLDFHNLSKAEFDGAVLQLRHQQIIELDRHDHPESLSAEQRDELVRDTHGNHFNAISFRKQH